jgi:hypothetical protein
MMTLKEFGENLKNLNEVFEQLRKKYQKPEIGKTIEVAGINWLVLDKLEKGYFAISEDFYGRDRELDDNCNDWKSSDLRNKLNTDLRKKIESELGTDSLVEFERNLLSLDGQTEYGTCRDYVSLISVDEYRKYRKLLPNTNKWWWTLTPDSTKCNDDTSYIRVVSPSGYVGYDICSRSSGVRPVCIFSSSIFESCEEDDD